MKKLFVLVLAAMVSACSRRTPANFVLVKGGPYMSTMSNFYGKHLTMLDFYIGKYEVTQKEWLQVMGNNPSTFKGDDLPVEMVSWYDCVEYCNKRSIKEGLQPYYNIEKDKKDPANTNELDDIKWTVTVNKHATGYRLPTEAEWEYAAWGGRLSRHYKYSGSDQVDDIAWYWKNSGNKYLAGFWAWSALEKNGNKTRSVGSKLPNELGLYDMSGNVREWCWDRYLEPDATAAPLVRIWKGGGWIGADFCCAPAFRAGHEANGKGPDQGFRVCRGMPE